MRLHRLRGLIHLTDAVAKGGVLVADVVDELRELLRLQALHSRNRAVVDEGLEFASDKLKPIEVLVGRGKAEQLAFECLLFEMAEELPCAVVPLFSVGFAALVRASRGGEKVADGTRLVKRRRREIGAVEIAPFLEKTRVLLETCDRLLIVLKCIAHSVQLVCALGQRAFGHTMTLGELLECGLSRALDFLGGHSLGCPCGQPIRPIDLFRTEFCDLFAKLADAFKLFPRIRKTLLSSSNAVGVRALFRQRPL